MQAMRDHRGKLLAVGDEYQVGDYAGEQLVRDGIAEQAPSPEEVPEGPQEPVEVPQVPDEPVNPSPVPEQAPEASQEVPSEAGAVADGA